MAGYSEGAKARLSHVESHLDGGFEIDRIVYFIEHNQGNPVACAGRLSAHAYAKGMQAWFGLQDLELMKAWFYTSGRLNKYAFGLGSDKMNFLYKMLEFMRPLVSDNCQLIDWFCQFTDIRDAKRIESTTTSDYIGYQIMLAVKGDWGLLAERCERMSANPPKGKTRRFLLDNEFFLALATSDIDRMESVLTELVSPKLIKARADSESGYSEGLISTYGVIYAKIAWRHGFEVKVDSPYIPAEWLPVRPLQVYDPHYNFLK
jgi:Immunity protein 49